MHSDIFERFCKDKGSLKGMKACSNADESKLHEDIRLLDIRCFTRKMRMCVAECACVCTAEYAAACLHESA